jgi:aminodeoxyfutalosine synthase
MALEEAWRLRHRVDEAVRSFILGDCTPIAVEYFMDLVRGLKVRFPKVHIQAAFTMVEVAFLPSAAR